MRCLISILFLSFMANLCFGQDTYSMKQIDSLINIPAYEAAEKAIAQGSAIASDPATRYLLSNKLSKIYISQGKLDQAESLLQSLISQTETTDPFLQAITKTNLGVLFLNKARNDLALENLQHALNQFQQAGKQETEEGANCLADLCLVYLSTGKLNQAEANGQIALQIRQRLKGEQSEAVAASYNDLGLVFSQTNDSDKALEYYEKALSIYSSLHGKGHPKIAIANTNLGFMYLQLKLYGDAVNSFEISESIWKTLYPNGHPNQAFALLNLGRTYYQMGNNTAALGYFEKSLAIYRTAYGDKHSDIAFVYNQMGSLKADEKQYNEALNFIQAALIANAPFFSNSDISKNPAVKDHYNGKRLLYSLRLKANALEARHYGKTLRWNELTNALQCLHSCDTLIDYLRYHSADENDKLELGSSANEVYEDGVRIATAMSQMSLGFKKYREEAFYFAEKSKSAVLQESIADAEAKSFSGIPTELLNEEKASKANIALLSQKLSQKPGEAEERILRENLFAANQRDLAFVQNLEKNYPAYYNLKFNRVTPSVAALQKVLKPRMAMVSYFIAENDHLLYTFVITTNTFKVYTTTLPGDFDRMVKGFNNSLFYSVPSSYRESSNVLSKLLLRGIPAATDELVIIPAGRLGTMPFEALSVRSLTEHTNPEYLISKKAISYEFSAGLLLQKVKEIEHTTAPTIFLCAPITFPEKDMLDNLPGTEEEVTNISKLFNSGARIAKGPEANEALIKSGQLSDYRYLHFATHGIVDETSPELSRLFLQSSSSEDGNVFSGEIFNLTLNADLAVLSACQTGLGKFSKGEGVIGLSRALVYAGARSIMVSYWSVADQSTANLMTDFYSRLLQQPDPNYRKALQYAKIKMIENKSYTAPYYWAPFVLVGF